MFENIFKNQMPQYQHFDCSITELGGMTNKNYLITVSNEKYVLRVPGTTTHKMINRFHEAENSLNMSQVGFNVETCAFDKETGIKITRFLNDSISLNHQNIKNPEILKKLARRLSYLHKSEIQLANEFNVFQEFTKYLDLLQNKDLFYGYNSHIPEILNFFESINTKPYQKNRKKSPCHNDLVPENILLQNENLYFIDWEYAGMNDPVFDIAAFFLESRINQDEQNLFLETYYIDQEELPDIKRDIMLYQFTQDVLWFVWTLIKAEEHEYFGNYGELRINRAYNTILNLKG